MNYKTMISVILAVCLLLTGCATAQSSTVFDFYYCAAQLDFGPEDTAVRSESRKEVLNHLAYNEIIEKYLEGPVSSDLRNPFPEGTAFVSITVEQQTASIVLSNAFAQLTGIELTVACACLSLTVGEFTSCPKIQISAQNALLDNRPSITIDINALAFTDSIT